MPALPDEDSGIHCRLDELPEQRGMTLRAICDALDCDVGDLLVVGPTP
ncbi:helix-turn-helix domain-containing protein [Cryobacterium aureum]|nr:helix-turn-helix domain-containing protein [Cryobacterium aureum]